VTGADANETLYIVGSFNGEGNGPCPQFLGGNCLSINLVPFLIGSVTTDNSGTSTFLFTPDTSYGGEDLSMQAVARRGVGGSDSVLSNALTNFVSAAGSCADPDDIPDCNGDCYPASWVGDGYCDDNTSFAWGSPDFDCSTFSFDDGDC
jgi:hypothetical protein